MKLLSTVNNSQALKVLVASCVAEVDISLEITTLEDKKLQAPRRLPALILDSGTQIFSSNAAVNLILQSKLQKPSSNVLQWLEWEAVKLQPTVTSCLVALAGGKKSDSADDLTLLLNTLSDDLQQSKFLVGDTLTAADICVWATLYPISLEKTISSIFPKNVSEWHSALSSNPSFMKGLAKLAPKSDAQSWAANLQHLPVQIPGVSLKEAASSACNKPVDKKVKSENSSNKLSKPVLPESGKRNVLITSALPYVNNVPHLGNIIGCVLSADVFARYCRGRGYNTVYISGTDEYGTATETKAIEEGLTPKQICDKYHKIHSQVYDWFNIQFDYFGRTSSEQHTEICQDIFLKIHKNGLTLTESMEQLLCQKCDRFLADRFVEGECPLCGYEDARGDQCDKCGRLVNATELRNPRCKLCQQTPVTRSSTHFFLDLPKVESRLRTWMAKSSPGWTSNASVIAQTWIKDGLKPRCITRDLKWGIPVPLDGFREKVFYVWFDAPLGYVSMTKCYTEQWEKWWKNPKEVEYFQFMAKDNVPFHSVMFPSTQLGSGDDFTIVNHIMATEYLNYEEGKFSKSRGVGVFGSDVQDTGISADIWRFYLLYVRPESQDSSFSWTDFMTKNNSELLNNLGNFINRALMFLEKNFNSTMPSIEVMPEDKELLANIDTELVAYLESLEKSRLRDGLRSILTISRHGNQYMQVNEPWVLVKGTDDQKKRAGSVVALCANISCLLAAILRPYMPATADIIQSQLAVSNEQAFNIPAKFSVLLPKGHKIGKVAPLFSKIDTAQVDALRAKFAGTQDAQAQRAGKSPAKTTSKPSNVAAPNQDLAALQAAVAAQGDLVRKLKSETKDKSVWQPEVNKLLDLKKQLSAAENSASASASSVDLASLEAEIVAQGEVVRKLKAETKDKAVWQPEVNKLLELKKKFAEAGGTPAAAPPKSSGKKKK